MNTILDKSSPDTDRAPPTSFSYDIFVTLPIAYGIRINWARRLLTCIHYFPDGGRVDGCYPESVSQIRVDAPVICNHVLYVR